MRNRESARAPLLRNRLKAMPTFQYKALQADGTIAEGEVEAGGRQEAFRQMESRGLRPVRLAERNGANGSAKSSSKAAPPNKTSAKESTPEKPAGSATGLKLSFGGAAKVSGRMLENF